MSKNEDKKINYRNKKGIWVKVFAFTLCEGHYRVVEKGENSFDYVYHKPVFPESVPPGTPKKWLLRAYL